MKASQKQFEYLLILEKTVFQIDLNSENENHHQLQEKMIYTYQVYYLSNHLLFH